MVRRDHHQQQDLTGGDRDAIEHHHPVGPAPPRGDRRLEPDRFFGDRVGTGRVATLENSHLYATK
jgi:hypothetical protein